MNKPDQSSEKKRNPLVSVIIPTYNRLKKLETEEIRRCTFRKTRSTLFRFLYRLYLKSRSCLRQARWSEADPSTRTVASSVSCLSRGVGKSRPARALFVIGSSCVWSRSFDSGSTAAYSQYCLSSSWITVSSTATLLELWPSSGYRSALWTQLWTVDRARSISNTSRNETVFKTIILSNGLNTEIYQQPRCCLSFHKL